MREIVDRIFDFLGYAPKIEKAEPDKTLELYDAICPKFKGVAKIVVPTEFDKEQILLASEYLHYQPTIDTDIAAVSLLVHLYQSPDLIEVIDGNKE